jgi:hypothetical protein
LRVWLDLIPGCDAEPMTDPRLDVMHAMRQKGNETQLTRAITALGKHDPELAAQLARAIVATAAACGNQSSATMLERVPGSLEIINEASLGPVQVGRRPASGGRLDWQMTDDTFCLVVEVKIGAALAIRQLERYLNSFSGSTVDGGLVLLTRTTEDVPVKVERHDRWLGQIRWDQLIPAMTNVTSADPVIAGEWKRMLSVMRSPGDLAEEPVGWQLGRHKVGARNRLVVSAICDLAGSTVAVELALRASKPTSDGLCRHKPGARIRSVVTTGDTACMGLYVPAATKRGPVIEIELTGTRKPLKLTTYINPGLPPVVGRKTRYDETLNALRRSGFTEQTNGWYAVHDQVAPTPSAATPQAALWAVLQSRLQAIVASGTLDSLVP